MKSKFYLFSLMCLFGFSSILAQSKSDNIGKTLTIKAYKNANNKKVDEKVKVIRVLELPHISLFVTYSDSKFITQKGTDAAGFRTYGTVDVSDTYWYCLRPGEDVAYMVSWTFNTQINKNNIFRKNATQYFKDYPELSKKIDERELKYDDIFEVVQMYNDWKVGK